jgi:squalene cyclase
MTSLGGLAWMAGGSTPEEGPCSDNVKKAMIYLLELAEARQDGCIAGRNEKRSTYGHGFAMLFLATCYGVESNPDYEKRIRVVLTNAINILYKGQSKSGGWLYTPTGGGDEGSTTGLVLQGLRACRNVGIKVPKEMIDKAVGHMKSLQNPDGGIAYSSSFRGGSRPALAAQALACFYAAGIYDRQSGGLGPEAAMVEKLWRYIKAMGDDDSGYRGFYFYHHFYMTQAMYHRGGAEWESHYRNVSKHLLETQAANGTWVGDDVGPTYGTAMGCIILQIPYGYLPACEK